MNAEKSRGGVRLISSKKRLILIVLLLVLGIVIYNEVKILRAKQYEYESKVAQVENLRDEIESEKSKEKPKNVSGQDTISDEEYESLAREELGLIKKDEIIIKPR